MSNKVRLLVATKKAAFVYTSDDKRERWEVSEPVMAGWAISHMVADRRSDPMRLYAAANHWARGTLYPLRSH